MMTFRIPHSSLSALLIALALPAMSHATPQTLVSGQMLTLPLTEASDGPTLKFEIAKATLTGSPYQPIAVVKGETREERKARGDQIVLDNDEGRSLVKFARFAADDLRARYAGQGKAVKVTVAFDEGLAVKKSALMGDALKAGFTFGIGTPATIAIFFNSHMEFTIEQDGAPAQTLVCDGQEEGRLPRNPRENDPRGREELNRMQDVGRKACFSQITPKLPGATAVGSP